MNYLICFSPDYLGALPSLIHSLHAGQKVKVITHLLLTVFHQAALGRLHTDIYTSFKRKQKIIRDVKKQHNGDSFRLKQHGET